MRRTHAAVAATSALALAGGALVALPVGSASAIPSSARLLSVSASPTSYVSKPDLSSYNNVTVTAVFNDPAREIDYVSFDNAGTGPQSRFVSRDTDSTSVDSGAKRTFSFTFRQNFSSVDAGVNRVYVAGIKRYSQFLDGTTGSTSFVIKNKPSLQFSKTTGLRIWGTKANFFGTMASTSQNANQKVRIEFDRKGKQKGKKWKKRQVVRTNDRGQFFTKKFKINKVGRYRARFAGTTYVLPVTAVYKVTRSS
jgi:hypothetical protein